MHSQVDGESYCKYCGYHFGVKSYPFVIGETQQIQRQFIVLYDADQIIIGFTDFHKYIHSSRKRGARHISDDGNNRFRFVASFLNYIFFENSEKYHIKSITKITRNMIQDFFLDFGLKDDGRKRTKGTVDRCAVSIIDFLSEVIKQHPKSCSMKLSDFTSNEIYRTKRGYTKTRLVPSFDVYYENRGKPIFRDMPNSVFDYFLSYAAERYQDIFFLIVLSSFAGLRPSEACNVSEYNMNMNFVMGSLQNVEIDLLAERPMRLDLKKVGLIKKERKQKVYPKFLEAFLWSYNLHMEYLKNKKRENRYLPLSVNQSGKAYTYPAYYARFKKLVSEITPILLKSDDPEVVEYGLALQENNISPHIFRHWFSVRLTLYGEDVAGLQYWRGDKNPESALVYLQNKGELEKQLRQVGDAIFDFANYKSSMLHSKGNDVK